MDRSSLISIALSDMRDNPQIDCWLSRVQKINNLFSIKKLAGTPNRAGLIIDKNIKSKFDRFFLDEVNQNKIGTDGLDHNKLRLYKKLKGSFKIEPYIEQIRNRNQRQWLSRYRISAHSLGIEIGRYKYPVTPLCERKCNYCESNEIDDEKHFILLCDTFKLKRQCFISRMNVLYANFSFLSSEDQLKFILCPPTIEIAKCVSKFLGIMTKTRTEIDAGLNPNYLFLLTNILFIVALIYSNTHLISDIHIIFSETHVIFHKPF